MNPDELLEALMNGEGLEDDFGVLQSPEETDLPKYEWKKFKWDWKAETLTIHVRDLTKTGFGFKKPFVNPVDNLNPYLEPKNAPVIYGFKVAGDKVEIVFGAPTNELAEEETYFPVVNEQSPEESKKFLQAYPDFRVIVSRKID